LSEQLLAGDNIPPQPPPTTARHDLHVQMVCQMVTAAILVGAAIYWLRPVLLPFVMALFLVSGLAPILEWIEKRLRVGRLVSVTVAFALGVLIVAALWSAVWYSLVAIEANLTKYEPELETLLSSFSGWLPELEASKTADKAPDGASPAPVDPATATEEATHTGRLEAYINQQFQEWLGDSSLWFFELFSTATTVLIFMLFLLMGNERLSTSSIGIWNEVQRGIRSYIVLKTLISVFTGVAFGITLWLFDVPLAVLFGVLGFLLHYIPHIGPIVAALLPIPLIVIHPEMGYVVKALAILAGITVQTVAGNVVEPLVMGESFQMHPVAVMLSLMFWGMIWGLAGMFLAVPITAAICILLERFEVTRGVSLFITGRLNEITDVSKPKLSLE
jgi:AI-2 transport protein TqsA